MAQLSAQSIYKLCMEGCGNPMILPFIDHKEVVNGMSFGLSAASYDVRIAHPLRMPPRTTALGHTIEDFCMPANVVGYVIDKSSWARRFVSAMNTLIDPGFHGNLTLELIPNPDILAFVADLPNAPFCVGFAAESENLREYAEQKRRAKKLPLLAANLAQQALGADDNELILFDDAGEHLLPRADKLTLARALLLHAATLYQKGKSQ